jgi:hypothetical protein
MDAHEKLREQIRQDIAQPDDRSSLFWWMLDNHAWMVEAGEGRRMRWGKLCSHFAALGLTDWTGKPATRGAARQTWFRVRRDVEAARKRTVESRAANRAELDARKQFPSRLPADLRPKMVERMRDPVSVGVVAFGGSDGAGEPDARLWTPEYLARRNEKGPDGKLTEAAIDLRRSEVTKRGREKDLWMGHGINMTGQKK